MKKLIYIAGKISSGTKSLKEIEKNLKEYQESVVKLKKNRKFKNYVPVIVAAANNYLGNRLKWKWEDYLEDDIEILKRCDAVYMTHNWKDSQGAWVEYFIAKVLGKKIIYEKK